MPPERPNLLVIMCDQLRRGALACAGDPNAVTPHLDDLARTGARFANSCTTYPICVPTRFTLMTGEYAHNRFVPGRGWRMSPAERTIGHELADRGYQTAYVGKWHLYATQAVTFGPSGPGKRKAWTAGKTFIPRHYRGGFEYWRAFEIRDDHFDASYFRDDDPVPHPLGAY